MLNTPNILVKSSETNQFHQMDINSFLLNEARIIVLEGLINNQVAEALNLMFLSLQRLEPSKIQIIMTNTKCFEFRYIFSFYEQIKILQSRGFEISLEINGTVSELAVLFAFMNVKKKVIRPTSFLVINELKVDSSFEAGEMNRLQASDQIAYLNYFMELKNRYYGILSSESGLSLTEIENLHERHNYLNQENIQKLGFVLSEDK